MEPESRDDLLDRLVGEFSDRLAAGGEPDEGELASQVPAEQRETLLRCLRMVRAGLVAAPRGTDALVPGSELEGFRILREIGRGGMAVVYLAEEPALQRRVALKVLRPGLALDSRHVERFQREAMAVGSVQHAHIVQVHAVGESRGYHWLAMEYVPGPTLAEVLVELEAQDAWTAADLARVSGVAALAEHPGYEQAVCTLLAPVGRALATAHELGMVHRDVKPSNILIHPDGRALIADFGLAKGRGDPGLSLSGQPVGTPYYMSPEQAELSARPVDQRSDVYSMGVTLYEALSGRRPFEGESVLAVLDAIRHGAPESLRVVAPRCTRDAEAVVRRAMAFEAAERYGTAIELSAELTALAEGRVTQARAQEGGALRRALRGLQNVAGGRARDYRSARTFLGLPLVHICAGPRRPGQRARVAKGWLAAGDVALGGITFGGLSIGLVSFGGAGLGLLAGFGGFATGLVSFGGFALGGFPLGGLAVGFSAIGGMAVGHYAMGGDALGNHVVTHSVRDPEALRWFQFVVDWVPLLGERLRQVLEA